MAKENINLPEGVTPQKVDEWKAKYGEGNVKLAVLKKNDQGETMDAVVHTPNRTVIGEFEKHVESNPNKAKEVLVKGCVLSGLDEIMREGNDLLFFSAFNACSKLMPKAESELKNL